MENLNSKTKKWISAILQNDEVSTDKELIEYYISNGVDKDLACKVVAQRQQAILNPYYKIDYKYFKFCSLCNTIIEYPNGVYCKGIEYHIECIKKVRGI